MDTQSQPTKPLIIGTLANIITWKSTLIAVRGVTSIAQENTEKALGPSVDTLPDTTIVRGPNVMAIADGSIVCCHDTDLKGYTGLSGNICKMTRSEVEKLMIINQPDGRPIPYPSQEPFLFLDVLIKKYIIDVIHAGQIPRKIFLDIKGSNTPKVLVQLINSIDIMYPKINIYSYFMFNSSSNFIICDVMEYLHDVGKFDKTLIGFDYNTHGLGCLGKWYSRKMATNHYYDKKYGCNFVAIDAIVATQEMIDSYRNMGIVTCLYGLNEKGAKLTNYDYNLTWM